jgi:hypothetical protein
MVKRILPQLLQEGMALPYAHLLLDMSKAMLEEARTLSMGQMDDLLDWDSLMDYMDVYLRQTLLPDKFGPRELRDNTEGSLRLDLLIQDTLLLHKAHSKAQMVARLLEDAETLLRYVAGDEEEEEDYELHDALCHAAQHFFALSKQSLNESE